MYMYIRTYSQNTFEMQNNLSTKETQLQVHVQVLLYINLEVQVHVL